MNQSADALFKLIRIALGNEKDVSLPNDVNWKEVYDLSLKQSVGAIACDGMLALKECNIDEVLRYKWMGQSLVLEQKYYQHKKALAELADFYRQHNIQMMLLKGYGLSLNYPIPEHRPSGDLDIYLFEDKMKSDDLVENELRLSVKKSYEKHSSFEFHGVTVENHSTFFDIYSHPSNRYVDDYIRQLIDGRTEEVVIGESRFVIPNPTLMAIHLLRHTACDFAANSISLRQVMDWALLVTQRGSEMEWQIVNTFVDKTGMSSFFNLINEFCKKRLSTCDSILSLVKSDSEVVRFENDILYGKRVSDFPSPSQKLSYGVKKSLQFWQNRWKYKMVYSDSLFNLYFTIAKNRLIH